MKRQREENLEEEIGAIKSEINDLQGEKAEWKTKAEAAEREGRDDKAKEHFVRYDTVNIQLASLQNRLDRKEAALADESKLKREKAGISGNAPFCIMSFS
jgi:hypothetical protein